LSAFTATAHAGMPVIRLSDWAGMRIQTISFFLFLLFVVAFAVQRIWNYLSLDFGRLPHLGYRRALALTMIVGLGLSIVLSMISGARELFTPAAWQRNGLVYKIAPIQSETDQLLYLRKLRMQKLRTSLWTYVEQKEGMLPLNRYTRALSPEVWRSLHPSLAYFSYRRGHGTLQGPVRLIAYEPDVYEKKRFALYSDGAIKLVEKKVMEEEWSR